MSLKLSTKRSLFPVQRVAVIVASRAATIFFSTFFLFGRKFGKYGPFLKKKL